MPQTASAKKALRASVRRRATNDRWRRAMRAASRAVRDTLTAGNTKDIPEKLTAAYSAIDRAARHRVLHWRAAARKKSRLQKLTVNLRRAQA